MLKLILFAPDWLKAKKSHVNFLRKDTQMAEINEELKEIEKMIDEGNLRPAFRDLYNKIKTNPQLSEDALHLIDKGFDAPNLSPRSELTIYIVLSTIADKSPTLGEKVLERFKKGFSLIQNPEDIDQYYDAVAPLASHRPDLYEGLLDLQHQVEEHYKKLGGKTEVGSNVYQRVRELTKSLPDIGQKYLEDVDQKLSSENVDAVDLANAGAEMSQIIQADSKWAPLTIPLIEKALNKNENTSYSLLGFYRLLEMVHEKSPDSRESVLRLLSNALKSEKNNEDSLDEGLEFYTNILKEQIQSDNIEGIFMDLKEFIENNPKLSERVFDLVEEGFKRISQRPPVDEEDYDLSAIHDCLASISTVSPEYGESVLKCFKRGFTLIQDPHQIDADYDLVSSLVYSRPDLTDGLLELQDQAEMLQKKLGGKGTLKNVYRRLSTLIEKDPKVGEKYLKIVDKQLQPENIDKYPLANIYEGLSFAINTSPDLAESAFKLLKKGLEVETNDDRSLLGASHLMENISKVKPNLRDDILVLLPKILQSEKITEETSNQIQKIYINIQKEKNVARSQELKATLAERQGEKVLSPTEPTTHDSTSPTPSKPNGRDDGGR